MTKLGYPAVSFPQSEFALFSFVSYNLFLATFIELIRERQKYDGLFTSCNSYGRQQRNWPGNWYSSLGRLHHF